MRKLSNGEEINTLACTASNRTIKAVIKAETAGRTAAIVAVPERVGVKAADWEYVNRYEAAEVQVNISQQWE